MFCQRCGKEQPEDTTFCSRCGDTIKGAGAGAAGAPMGSNHLTFQKSISTCFSKFAAFDGRATRSEYWWFYLFTVIVSWGSVLVDPSQLLSALISLAFMCPVLAAGSRRLHDTNRSGWWQLLSLTLIGAIPVVIWLASSGDSHKNQYGSPSSSARLELDVDRRNTPLEHRV